jgi:hypothetical protein
MKNDLSKLDRKLQLTDEELIKLGLEVVNWTVPMPSMATYEEVANAFERRQNLYGHMIGFADSVSEVLYGGECGWCSENDIAGLKAMTEKLRNQKCL